MTPEPVVVFLRVTDLRFTCLTCGATVRLPGLWDGPRVAAWAGSHRAPWLTEWTVSMNGGVGVTRHRPPPSPVTAPPWTG